MTQRVSASSIGRQMACPASANLDVAIPGWVEPTVESKAATKGTNVHKILADVMEMSASDMRCFIEAVEYVQKIRSQRRFKVLIEQTIEASWLASKPSTQVDLVLYTQDEIHVIDWKTGTIPVSAINNEQLKYYAVCFAPLAPKAKGVTVHIVQPWAKGHIASEFVDTNDLQQFMLEAKATEQLVLAKDTTFGVSDKCMFCPAYPHSRGVKGRPLCPAAMNLLYPNYVDEDEILNL